MTSYIYLRALRHVDHTVFSVSDGQKRYYDPVFGRYAAYSSGQQVKRSIIQSILDHLNESPSPVVFNWKLEKINDSIEKAKAKEGEALSKADPNYTDQLLGGWMSAPKEGGTPVKRRSPLSISAMRPLHPALSNIYEENASFDRSSHHGIHKVVVKDEQGNEVPEEILTQFLKTHERVLPARKYIQGLRRTGGLFIYDVAIDLRTLFCVSLNQDEPELSKETIEHLKETGWEKGKNTFGECLVCPKVKRNKIIPALAKALINWRITSNQSRTFSPMETLAVAISTNANKIASAIRTKLMEDSDPPRVKPIIDENLEGVDVFVTLPCAGYVVTQSESAEALDLAEQKLKELISQFDFENQVSVNTKN